MDQYTRAAIEYLSSKRGVRNVASETNTGVSELEIAKWEDQNLPHELPEDYKSFLRISNGFRIKWDLLFHGEPVQLGDMCISKLKDVHKVQLNISTKDDREPLENYLNVKRNKLPVAAFCIDRHCNCGKVALVYSRKEIGSKEIPEVWFQDLSGKWNFLSSSFLVYFRMMVAHLGLPNWQYRFTEYGMDPISNQWFYLIAPEDFTFDLNAQNVRPLVKGKREQRATTKGTSTGTQKVKTTKGERDSSLKIGGRAASRTSVSSLGPSKDRVSSSSSSRRKKQNESRELLRSAYRVRPKSAFN